MEKRRNIILIGMPGAGKTTIANKFAEKRAWNYVDTDQLIEARQGLPLQQVFDQEGYWAFRKIEETILLALDCTGYVIATGGSVVYSEQGMLHLSEIGTLVYLEVELSELKTRLDNFTQRGIVRLPEQSLIDLYQERVPLYQRYADIQLKCSGQSLEAILQKLSESLKMS
ncbi:shikimate kinase [Deltaproteobacteria bacterium TL4]